jgi:transposase
MNNQSVSNHQAIVGGVDTHKDLHFTAVVDAI